MRRRRVAVIDIVKRTGLSYRVRSRDFVLPFNYTARYNETRTARIVQFRRIGGATSKIDEFKL